MLKTWLKASSSGIPSIANDTRTVSLNFLAAIGFRQSFSFQSSIGDVSKGDKYSYRDALQIVLDNVVLLMLIPRKHLLYSWLPAWMRKIGKAGQDFQQHMDDMLSREMANMNQGDRRSAGLMPNMVRGLDENQKDSTKGISAEQKSEVELMSKTKNRSLMYYSGSIVRVWYRYLSCRRAKPG
ncbi:hypothetical protein EJ04DRAFT_267675 [Polyplosphaeria fusca]|uniref:Uncharacterized protein n=1 Tax=Polyplosphaeria fusca TaxID=682080 RepID=A0A9P4QY69_9PLEO|nr:hypothetical protein EJ04DRAFT_267675 [Polyplosphaeria fusca]